MFSKGEPVLQPPNLGHGACGHGRGHQGQVEMAAGTQEAHDVTHELRGQCLRLRAKVRHPDGALELLRGLSIPHTFAVQLCPLLAALGGCRSHCWTAAATDAATANSATASGTATHTDTATDTATG